MHQICHGFIVILNDGRNWAKKLVFWLLLRSLLFTLSYVQLITLQVSVKKKSLMKLLGHGKFKSIAFVVVKVFKDFCAYSASMTWSILGGFGALSPPNKAWFHFNFQERYSLIRKKKCLKNFSKFWVFTLKGTY